MIPDERTEDAARAVLGHTEEVATRLAAADAGGRAARDMWCRVVVELLNAGGVPMSGETISDAAPRSPDAVLRLAAVLGARATPHRGHYSVYPHPKPSVGASATVLYTDAATGEPALLLVRRAKDAGQWTYPAGYMELLPEGDRIVPDRVGDAARHVLEEQTEGVLAGQAVPAADPPPAPVVTPLPSGRQVRAALDREFRALLAARGWEEADALMNDARHVRAVLAREGVGLPGGIDMTIGENLVREVREETGLDLSGYPDARPAFVRMNVSLAYSSGGQRNYTANPHFLVDLGTRAAAPPLGGKLGDVVEAAWVPVRRIVNSGDGRFPVGAGDGWADLPLNPYTLPPVQESLHAWLSAKIGELTSQEYGSPRNVWVAAGKVRGGWNLETVDVALRDAARRIRSEEPSADGMLTDLTGPEGVGRIRDYLAVAAMLGATRGDRPTA